MKIQSRIKGAKAGTLFTLVLGVSALIGLSTLVDSATAARTVAKQKEPEQPELSEAARLIVSVRSGRHDVPRVELAARLVASRV